MTGPDDTDMTEDDIDQAMSGASPVEISSVTDPAYLLQLYTQALAEHDCAKIDVDVPDKDHDFWEIWRSNAKAVLKVRDRHLEQLRQRLNIAIKGIDGPPAPDYVSAWTELTGYVQEAIDDGGTIEPTVLMAYMRELKHTANAPVRAWFDEMVRRHETDET